jgi:hypothetical protein
MRLVNAGPLMASDLRDIPEPEPGIWLSSSGGAGATITLTNCFEDFSSNITLHQAQGGAFCFSVIVCLAMNCLELPPSIRNRTKAIMCSAQLRRQFPPGFT